MSEGPEPTVRDRVGERPSLSLSRLRNVKARDLVIRFIAGALTSIVAGLLTLAAGSRAGGVMLAFPAILAASLTLIEEQEDSEDAREDARGALVGGFALAAFAAMVAVTLPEMNGAAALALATAAWFTVALTGYAVLWLRMR